MGSIKSHKSAEWPLTDEDDDEFEKIDAAILEVAEEKEERISQLSMELARAKLCLEQVKYDSSMWRTDIKYVHAFWLCVIAVSIAAFGRPGSAPPLVCPSCPEPGRNQVPEPGTSCGSGTREVSFWHNDDYNYDFRMLGGFVSEITGKAEKAGLKIGDEIFAVNGEDVREKATEVIKNLIWKIDVPSGKEESRWARHDWETPITLVVKRNLPAFERLQVAVASAGGKLTDSAKQESPSTLKVALACLGFTGCYIAAMIWLWNAPKETPPSQEPRIELARLFGIVKAEENVSESIGVPKKKTKQQRKELQARVQRSFEMMARQSMKSSIKEKKIGEEETNDKPTVPANEPRDFEGLQKTLDEFFPKIDDETM